MGLRDKTKVTPQPIDEFSGGETEITYNPPKEGLKQSDITTAPPSVFKGGDNKDPKAPLVGEPDEVIAEKSNPVKSSPAKDTSAKPTTVKDKPDFVQVMRDNNLELYTKEMFTNDVSDEDFATQLKNDKFLGKQSYTKEIDYNTFDYYPKHVAKQIDSLKEDIGRTVANLSPEQMKELANGKGADERIFNKYISLMEDNMGAVAATSVVSGLVGGYLSKSMVGGFIAGAVGAYSVSYGVAETANAIDRANRTSPEELKGMKNTQLNKSSVHSLLSLAEENASLTPKVREFINELTRRDVSDSTTEAYVKEFSSMFLDTALGVVGGSIFMKGVGAVSSTYKLGKRVVSKAGKAIDEVPELNTLMDKLTELLELQKTVKLENKRLNLAKKSFADIDADYSHVPPAVPNAKNAKVDFDQLAGDALDKYIKSGGKDKIAFEDFRINNVRGSNYNLNTKLTSELPKDIAEAQLKAKKTSKTWGKGDQGGGTTIMGFTNKFDELGAMRKKAIANGDLDLDAHLATLQDDIENRITISLTQHATNMQEINRSMPMRRQMKALQNESAFNLSELKQKNLTATARKNIEARQLKINKELERSQTMLNEATSTELATMAIANSIYSNMLGGAAIAKAAIGGLASTANNMVLLSSKGVHPSQIMKMQLNAARRLKNDFYKFDLRQFRSDVVSGSVTSRFKAKNVANVAIKESDSITRKGLKTINKGVNVAASPIQIGLGTVDFVMDRFNRQSRAAEFWLDYVRGQKALGRTGDELVDELQKIIKDPSVLESNPAFYKQVMQATEEGLATDKMMLNTNHSKGYVVSKPAWIIDKFFNSTTNNNAINTALKFVNPFTRTAASMLDSIAENSAIGMFRQLAPNEKFAKLTARQIQGTVIAMGTAYSLRDKITIVPKGSEKTAGAFGLRSGIQIGGHVFPMSVLGITGDMIERFSILTDTIEASMIDGVDTSDSRHILGGLLEVLTVTGAVENVEQTTQFILNIVDGKSKTEVTKMIEKFAPAGYAVKAVADITHGSLASNPYIAQVFGEMDTKFGNAKRRDSYGTNISEGENVEVSRGISWVVDRKGEDKAGIKINKMLLASGVFESGALAVFKTDGAPVPHRTIMTDGNFTPLKIKMTPLSQSITSQGGDMFNVSLATKHNALGVMSLDRPKMLGILDNEIASLTYLTPESDEGKFLKSSAIKNIKSIRENMQAAQAKLAQYGMNKTLPKTLALLMENDAPNVTKSFNEKSYAVRDLMRFNKGLFNGDLNKQKEFFTRVHRLKNTVLYYNYIKQAGTQFMRNSAEAVNAEISRIEKLKSQK